VDVIVRSVNKVSTRADVYIGDETFHIRSDGYPDSVIPGLKGFVEEAKELAKKAEMDFKRALRMIVKENVGYYEFLNGEGEIGGDYDYTIKEDGTVLWRDSDDEKWKTLKEYDEV